MNSESAGKGRRRLFAAPEPSQESAAPSFDLKPLSRTCRGWSHTVENFERVTNRTASRENVGLENTGTNDLLSLLRPDTRDDFQMADRRHHRELFFFRRLRTLNSANERIGRIDLLARVALRFGGNVNRCLGERYNGDSERQRRQKNSFHGSCLQSGGSKPSRTVVFVIRIISSQKPRRASSSLPCRRERIARTAATVASCLRCSRTTF